MPLSTAKYHGLPPALLYGRSRLIPLPCPLDANDIGGLARAHTSIQVALKRQMT